MRKLRKVGFGRVLDDERAIGGKEVVGKYKFGYKSELFGGKVVRRVGKNNIKGLCGTFEILVHIAFEGCNIIV